jgi:2,4-dienoyl-CoA reductase (NADPH2)
VFNGMPVFCAGNPQAGFEEERQILPAPSPKRVMIIGAGLAGLEAAVTAAQMGHTVELYDQDSDIGGQIWIAGAPPHKKELLEFIRYYRAMISKYNIPLYLNTRIGMEDIKTKQPDYVIIAEGAQPMLPKIDGIDRPGVMNSWQVLKENPPLGREVAIIGGGAVGLETALFAAAKGTINPEILHFLFEYDAEPCERLRELMFTGTSRVTVFEMLPKAGTDIGKSTKWVLFDKLNRYGVNILTAAKVLSIKESKLEFEQNGEIKTFPFDSVIVASGSRAVQELSGKIGDLGIPYATVGDCIEPGKINDAIHGGFLAAMGVDKIQDHQDL